MWIVFHGTWVNGTKLSPLFWKMLHSSITWLKKFTSLGKLKNHVSWFFSISFKNLNLERTTLSLPLIVFGIIQSLVRLIFSSSISLITSCRWVFGLVYGPWSFLLGLSLLNFRISRTLFIGLPQIITCMATFHKVWNKWKAPGSKQDKVG